MDKFKYKLTYNHNKLETNSLQLIYDTIEKEGIKEYCIIDSGKKIKDTRINPFMNKGGNKNE